MEAFDAGHSVLVAAPTGSGKTVIAEHGMAHTLRDGGTSFYTSPIKALANQKFRDFGERFGRSSVGLLTGDVTVNGDAPIVIMTTEVLRNMLYEGSPRLRTLGCVVLDEVHYLQDRERGPVWGGGLAQPAGRRADDLVVGDGVEPRRVRRMASQRFAARRRSWSNGNDRCRCGISSRQPIAIGARSRSNHFSRAASSRRALAGFVPIARVGGIQAGALEADGGTVGDRRPSVTGYRPRRTQLSERLVRSDLGPLIWFILLESGLR